MTTPRRLDSPVSQESKRTRLIIDISPGLRKRVRLAAAQSDLSMREYVESILERAVPDAPAISHSPRRRLDRTAFERLRNTWEAIERAHPGVVFEDSAETIRQMRQERSDELEQ